MWEQRVDGRKETLPAHDVVSQTSAVTCSAELLMNMVKKEPGRSGRRQSHRRTGLIVEKKKDGRTVCPAL